MNAFNQPQQKAWSLLTASLTFASLLLAVVFAAGCSEQGISTLSPDDQAISTEATTMTESEQELLDGPLLAKPPSSSDATYRVTFSGDVSGGPGEVIRPVKPNSSSVPINPMTLNIAYFQTALADGGNCFSAGTYTGPLQIKGDKNDASDHAQAYFYFYATGADGVTEIKYWVGMSGTFSDATNFPPALGSQTTATMTTWEMAVGGGKRDRKIACTGEGTFNTGVTILVERIN